MMKMRFVKWMLMAMLLPMSASVYAGFVDKGGDFEVDGIRYVRTTDGDLFFVEVAAKSYEGSIVVKDEVENIQYTYTVTGVGDQAFADQTGVTDVTLPASIEYIGAKAFSGCTGLTKVTMQNATPCNLAADAFAGIADKVVIYVPKGAKEAYKAADVWKDLTIKEEGESEGIKGDVNGDGSVSVSDIVVIANAIAANSQDPKYDVNGDGSVSVSDIVTLANIIANGSN
jgi:hypothetical protein